MHDGGRMQNFETMVPLRCTDGGRFDRLDEPQGTTLVPKTIS
jgi:hypothetical protein